MTKKMKKCPRCQETPGYIWTHNPGDKEPHIQPCPDCKGTTWIKDDSPVDVELENVRNLRGDNTK